MAETNQPVPLLIPEPEGEGFQAGEKSDGRHGLKQRLRLALGGVFPMPDLMNPAPTFSCDAVSVTASIFAQ